MNSSKNNRFYCQAEMHRSKNGVHGAKRFRLVVKTTVFTTMTSNNAKEKRVFTSKTSRMAPKTTIFTTMTSDTALKTVFL
jgi:hypothetical protein